MILLRASIRINKTAGYAYSLAAKNQQGNSRLSFQSWFGPGFACLGICLDPVVASHSSLSILLGKYPGVILDDSTYSIFKMMIISIPPQVWVSGIVTGQTCPVSGQIHWTRFWVEVQQMTALSGLISCISCCLAQSLENLFQIACIKENVVSCSSCQKESHYRQR